MARRPTRQVEDAVREAVERTVQATIGSAQVGRERAQDAVDEIVRSAEAGASSVRERVREAIEGQRPASQDDIKVLHEELRRIGKRLDAIEQRLPKPRSSGSSKPRSSSRARS